MIIFDHATCPRVIYLHDTPIVEREAYGAELCNIDTIDSIEKYIICNKSSGKIIVTTDDGYKTNINLLDLIEKYDLKLVIFITASFISRDAIPYELLVSRIVKEKNIIYYDGVSFDVSMPENKEKIFNHFHNLLKTAKLKERNIIFNKIMEENSFTISDMDNPYLSWEEIKTLSDNDRVEIGSHCYNHIYLPSQNYFRIIFELLYSKVLIQRMTGKRVTKISYPYGGSSRLIRLFARLIGYEQGYGTQRLDKWMCCGRQGIKR